MNKFTYGYIREAVIAHLDLDESEAQAMDILKRFPIFANEAMQAICASKPKYEYVDVKVVKKFTPLVLEGVNFLIATTEQIKLLEDWLKLPEDERPDESTLPKFANRTQLEAYWHKQNIYEVGEKISMNTDFITFANKQAYKIITVKKVIEDIEYAELPDNISYTTTVKKPAIVDDDFSYIGKSQLKFYKEGEYQIPAKFVWHVFESGISDEEELDMPADILACIPIYIASICLQIDNPTRAQLKRSEFEMALARCTSTEFMTNNSIKSTW